MVRKSLVNLKFGLLTVKDEYRHTNYKTCGCYCDCGHYVVVRAGNLTSGNTKSCGCLKLKAADKWTYNSWASMKSRCYDSNKDNFKWYGGKGIAVVDRWHDYKAFLVDMGVKPGPYWKLGRKDHNKNYGPDNCQWEPPRKNEQINQSLAVQA